MRARELMSSPVITVSPDTPLKEVAELMLSRRVSGLPVVDGGDHLVGIISESDFLPKLEQTQRAGTKPGLLGRLAHLVWCPQRFFTMIASPALSIYMLPNQM